MQLRADGVIRVHWTREIDDEWIRNLATNLGHDRKIIENRLGAKMKENAEDWEVDGYERYQEQFPLVDRKDRHVAAAAYKLSCDVYPEQEVALITDNIKDLPRTAFKKTRVSSHTFSAYITALIADEPDKVADACDRMLARLRNPLVTRAQFVDGLRTVHGCRSFAEQLEAHWKLAGYAAPHKKKPPRRPSRRKV